MTDTELDQVRKITPAIASEYLQHLHTTVDIRLALQSGVCPFGFARNRTGNRWVYRIDGARLKAYKRGEFPLMGQDPPG